MIDLNLKSWFAVFAAISISVIACKKDDPKPVTTDCKNKPTGQLFTEIQNLDFETWYTGKTAGKDSKEYHNPGPKEFWATPNFGSGDLGVAQIPVTVYRVEGAEARTGYAAKIVTGEGTLLGKKTIVSGTIASGDFEVNINNPLQTLKFGKRFEKRPTSVSGYYRYYPVGGDSASVYCFVTKLDANCKVDTIGFGRKIFYDQQETYAKFDLNVDYKNNEKPESIVIYFSSSEAGDEFKGQPGNTIYFDDVTVTYE